MDRFTFNTFVVKNGNREASDLCMAVANLQPVKPQPLLLVGDSGAGKTHLLCAIVNHIKKHAPRTALAYVTAKDFPSAVRALAEDAGPVTRARSAVLLVDQFEKLPPAMLERLARIAPLFLEDNRYLVIAAQTDPQDLPGVPARLLDVLEAGRVSILEKAAAPAMVNESLAEQRILEQEVRSLRRALDEARRQRDTCQADSSALAAATAELGRLRRQIAAAPATPEPVDADSLEQARQDAKDAQAELDRWALRAQAILQQVELNRARFAENAELQLQRVLALQQQVEKLTAQSSEPGGAADIASQRPWYAAPYPLPPDDPSQGPRP